ncbi:MAG TPA: membrane dipeptidase [Myxococcales bacterium]|nr:membrane dipeptidase [Myxococcales bacterium]
MDAAAVHAAATVADLHAHPSLNAYYLRRDLGRQHRGPVRWNPLRQQLDLPRARAGGLKVLTNCVYAPSVLPVRPFRAALGGFAALERLCERHPELAQVARRRGDVGPIVQAGKLAVIHAAEGGHHVEGSLEKLAELAERGLRYLTLTHFVHNGIAQPARLPGRLFFSLLRGASGLTQFGRALVRRCEELGVLVDVTHCSDRSLADVLSVATRPLLATHTGFRRFAPLERNLSDEQAREIARTGGLIGVITWNDLLGGDSVEAMADSVAHGASVAGAAHVGIGTDFDGWVFSAKGIRDATQYPALTEALVRRGFSESELRGILGGNYLRVLGEA